MTPHDLLANFETLADAPNGIQRLRELVLELAVRGKLVEQNAEEGNAWEQFPELAEPEGLGEAPRRGRQGKGPDVPEEAPAGLPPSTMWVPIGRLMDLYNGRAFKPNEWASSGTPIIRIQNLNDPAAPFNYCNFEVPEKVHVKTGDLLISWSGTPGTSFGAFLWDRGPAVLNQHIFRVELRSGRLVPQYIRIAVNARLDIMIAKAHGGVGLRHITKGELEAIGIPIPPEAEQHRIVARVEKLMALLDRLEAKRQERETARTAALDSALAALREAPTPEDVETAWLRIEERFHELFATPDDVQPLKKIFLLLAMSGRLLAQSPEDTHASEVVEGIARSRKKTQRNKPTSSLSMKTPSFELPKGWTWCHLQDVGVLDRGKSRHRPRNDRTLYEGGTIPMIQTGDIARAHGIVNSFSYLYNEFGLAQSRLWPRGTLCITIAANIANTAILGIDACFPDSVVGFVPYAPISNAQYFELFIRTAKSDLETFAPSTAQKNINLGILEEVWIPLPPLNEMNRIVEYVELLMVQCDALEAALDNVQSIASAASSAAIHHLDT